MKPENEVIATQILVVLKKVPMNIEELSETLRTPEDKIRYVVTQMVKKKTVTKTDSKRYGHPVRVNAAAPPPLPMFEEAV